MRKPPDKPLTFTQQGLSNSTTPMTFKMKQKKTKEIKTTITKIPNVNRFQLINYFPKYGEKRYDLLPI